MENNYKPNSHKYKEEMRSRESSEMRKVEKVVSGPVTTQKKSGFRKLAQGLIAEDMPKVKSYILDDVLIPSFKKAISDIVRNGIDIILYGEAGKTKSSSTPGAKVSYRSYYAEPVRSDRDRGRDYSRPRSDFDFDEVLFANRGDAEVVLTQMEDAIEKYRFVRVADFYDLAGITISNRCVNNYGWTDLRSASIIRNRDGYIINLPKALPID